MGKGFAPTTSYSRRGLLAGTGALVGGVALAQAPARPLPPGSGDLIDTHHHVLPPAYLKLKGDLVRRQSQGMEFVLDWTPKQSIDVMDQAGVRAAVVSLSAPGVWFGDVAEGRELSRISNDYGAEFVAANPRRFGFFAALPLPDVDGSLAETRRAFETLKADGICLMTSYEGLYPGDPKFAAVFDELNRRKAVVYFHPTGAACCGATVKDVAPTIVEFPFDSTRAILSLLYSGTFSRCPDIKWIFSHGGGALPYVASRIQRWSVMKPEIGARVPKGPEYELKRLYFDCKDVTNPASFAALKTFSGAGQILFGTDYPYGRVLPDLAELRGLGLAPAELAAIEHGNAERLIPRLKR